MKIRFLNSNKLAIIVILSLGLGTMTACQKEDSRSRISGTRNATNKTKGDTTKSLNPTSKTSKSNLSGRSPITTEKKLSDKSISLFIKDREEPVSQKAVTVAKNIPETLTLTGDMQQNNVTFLAGNTNQEFSHLDNCAGSSTTDDGCISPVLGKPIIRVTDKLVVLPPTENEAVDDSQNKVLQYKFQQPKIKLATDSLDILFVIDTQDSSEWTSHLQTIARDFKYLLNSIDQSVKLKVAVLAAHSPDALNGKTHGRLFNFEAPGSSTPSPKVISLGIYDEEEITAMLVSRVAQIPSDPTSDGGQLGLLSLNSALQGENLKALRNDGFLLPEAALAIIFVSNENDICYKYIGEEKGNYISVANETAEVEAQVKFCSGITPTSVLATINKAKKGRPFSISGFLHNTDISGQGENEKGVGYLNLIFNDLTSHHVVQPISSPSFQTGYEDIARGIQLEMGGGRTELLTKFPLDLPEGTSAELQAIDVTVDNAPLHRSEFKKIVSKDNKQRLTISIPPELAGTEGAHIRVFIPTHVEEK